MIINRLRLCLLALPCTALFFTACQKEKSGTDATNQEETEIARVSSEANSEAEGTFNNFFDDVMGASDEVGISGTGVFYGRIDTLTPVPRCFTVTIEHPNTTPFPVRITIDFGTSGCTGPDGRVRRGKVIMEYTARLINPGAIATVAFDSFYVDDTHVEGTLRISNIAAVNTTERKYKVEVIDGKLTKANGNYIKWNSTRFLTQITGLLTPTPLDDVLRIEGSAQGQALRGNLLVGWQSTITEPLIKRFTCRYIVRGRIHTARLNSNSNSPWIAILDFGNGVCDNIAHLTINGQTVQITLP